MASRKTQFVWMALGCMVGLLGVVTLTKLEASSKAAAQTNRMPHPVALAGDEQKSSPHTEKQAADKPPEAAAAIPLPSSADSARGPSAGEEPHQKDRGQHAKKSGEVPPPPLPGVSELPPPPGASVPPLPAPPLASSVDVALPPPAKVAEDLPLPPPGPPMAPSPPRVTVGAGVPVPPLAIFRPLVAAPPLAAPEPAPATPTVPGPEVKAETLPAPLPVAPLPPPGNELKPIAAPATGDPLPPIPANPAELKSSAEQPALPNNQSKPGTGPSALWTKQFPPKMPADPLLGGAVPQASPIAPPMPMPVSAATSGPVPVRSIEPPLAPAPGPVVSYQVREGGETMREIARRTLGGDEHWADVHRLNPSLQPDSVITAGLTVKLPADACIHDDDTVQPLPATRSEPAPRKAKVALPLTGTFAVNLDDKKTVLLPRAIRDQLGNCDTLLVSPGSDQCLWLTNQTHLDRLADRLEHSPARELDVRTFKRLYFAQTEKTTVSDDGRITVPDRLAQFAGLRQEVVLIGIDDHFEVWDAAHWRQYTQQKSAAARAAMADRE